MKPTYLLAIAAILALGAAPRAEAVDDWRHVRPPVGDPFEHPPLRALATSPSPPADLAEKVTYRGSRRRYAQLRYGSPNSSRVAVVLDEPTSGACDLYVDSDRNRKIDARDKVEPSGDGRTWRLPLVVAPGMGESGMSDDAPRGVLVRLGATGTTLSFASAGFLEGRVSLGGRSHAARRVDGDGNGLLTDSQDRLWLDLDDDGRWDPSTEQFFFAPILSIGGVRYACRSDAVGRRLALAPLEGTGTIRLALARSPVDGSVDNLSAMLVGRDGSAVSLEGEGEATVPVGEYRLASTSVRIRDRAGSRWLYTFTDAGRRGPPVWHEVAGDSHARIDPIGELELRPGLDPAETWKPGEPVNLQPTLYNGEGLQVVSVSRGSAKASEEGPTAEVALRRGEDPPSSSDRSGFS